MKKIFISLICIFFSLPVFAQDMKMHILVRADGQPDNAVELTYDSEIYIDLSSGVPKLSVDGVIGDEISFEMREARIIDVINDEASVKILYVNRTITVEGYDGPYSIHDISGQLVASGVASDPVDVTMLPKGVYVFLVNKQALKFIKQ